MASGKRSSNTSRQNRRKRSWEKCNKEGGKKDARVEASSRGKFKSRKALSEHTASVINNPEQVQKRRDRAESKVCVPTWDKAFNLNSNMYRADRIRAAAAKERARERRENNHQ